MEEKTQFILMDIVSNEDLIEENLREDLGDKDDFQINWDSINNVIERVELSIKDAIEEELDLRYTGDSGTHDDYGMILGANIDCNEKFFNWVADKYYNSETETWKADDLYQLTCPLWNIDEIDDEKVEKIAELEGVSTDYVSTIISGMSLDIGVHEDEIVCPSLKKLFDEELNGYSGKEDFLRDSDEWLEEPIENGDE